jgi:hypothetical protein
MQVSRRKIMATTERTVIGVFDEAQSADRAIGELQNAGFNDTRILHIDNGGTNEEAGLFANLVNFFKPTEPSNTESPRDLSNDFENAGVSQQEADYYSTQYQNGKTLVTVNAGERYEDARLILTTNGAHNYNTATGKATSTAAEYDTNTNTNGTNITDNTSNADNANNVSQSPVTTTTTTDDGTNYNPTAGVPDTGYADAATMGTAAGMTTVANPFTPNDTNSNALASTGADQSTTYTNTQPTPVNTQTTTDADSVAAQSIPQNNALYTNDTSDVNNAGYADTPAPTNQVAAQNAGPLNTQNDTISDNHMATDPNATTYADQNTEPLTNQTSASVQNDTYTNRYQGDASTLSTQNDTTYANPNAALPQNDATGDDTAKRIATAKYPVSNDTGYTASTANDDLSSFANNTTMKASNIANNIVGNPENNTDQTNINAGGAS